MSMTLAQQYKAAKKAVQRFVAKDTEELFNHLKDQISADLSNTPPTIKHCYEVQGNTYSNATCLVVRSLMLDEGVKVDFIRQRSGSLEAHISYVEE